MQYFFTIPYTNTCIYIYRLLDEEHDYDRAVAATVRLKYIEKVRIMMILFCICNLLYRIYYNASSACDI